MNNSARRFRRGVIAEINLVPYIDVMLVLLVIFMITAPLLTQGVKVKLPQAEAKALPDKNTVPIVVTVDAAGHYYLNIAKNPQLPLDAATLLNKVAEELAIAKQKNDDLPVLVKGDVDVAYGKIINAMVLLQQAGVAGVGLVTEPLAVKG